MKSRLLTAGSPVVPNDPVAHTYERLTKPRGEFFHPNWTGTGGRVASSTCTV